MRLPALQAARPLPLGAGPTLFEWPLAKDRRAHVHGVRESHDLPVSHQTRRSGPPYTLVLRKTEALFQQACEQADVPYQKWVNRTDLACGSTIGPITAARLGIRSVDVGTAQLAMHSIREFCGARDPEYMVRALTAFFSS